MSISLSVVTAGLAMLVCFRTLSLHASQNSGIGWQRYESPEDAGFSTETLAHAKAFYESTPVKAVIVVSHGGVVAAWGEVERRFKCHSIRIKKATEKAMSAKAGAGNGTGAPSYHVGHRGRAVPDRLRWP